MSATNAEGSAASADQAFATPVFFARGDFNGDGVVAQDEMDSVFAGYWRDNPTVISNLLGAGSETVQLAVSNMANWGLAVETSTDLVTWSTLLDSAVPVFQFFDPDATNGSPRFYRLRAP
ncbi:MAG TPA: hypothetical protein P5567_12975 [Kiritimatiellia bacterium]|nr:hypothetical protein [Kiritimatiellia bacterium]HRZ13355.1 hypothetical protein [Kiritimatiellia bacterium]HSA19005.1 hypothetical protein [Kiritimatiellia bacterium]